MEQSADNKLILALDVETVAEARELFAAMREVVGAFKIGSQLFTAAGPEFVRELAGAGARIFLDLKFHDIPNTVAAAGVEAARLGVFMFNVHASGGSEMMRRTADAVRLATEREGLAQPKVIAVTVLTSADKGVLAEVGINAEPETQVTHLARLAAAAGLDGVVASPLEIEAVRGAVEQKDFLIVTPGVRPAGSATDDQRRVMTPGEAVRAGADYLVVGRAILNAPDPVEAAIAISQEMKRG
ncbi:MAG: orotidine-5'-phosphate decarboxylase [Pyrinomonadaceae bacterium]|nr:orotidine-5'-phosphate decarboxylase [Pyrinomonadaceae bacterium]